MDEQRVQETVALGMVLVGVKGALSVLPDDSPWQRCLQEIKTALTAQTAGRTLPPHP